MKSHTPQLCNVAIKTFATVLFVCAGAVCADAYGEVSSSLGFGSESPNKYENSLKGNYFDLTRLPKTSEMKMNSKKKDDTIVDYYDSDKKCTEQLHNAIGILDKTWRIENVKNKYAVTQVTRYTPSIYIYSNGVGQANREFKGGYQRKVSYLCYYEGYFGVPEAGEYRFVGMAGDVMLVGVDVGDGKKTQTVLYAFEPKKGHGSAILKCGKDWEPADCCGKTGNDGVDVAESNVKLYKGSWLRLTPGKRYLIQVAFGKATESGNAYAYLGIQKKWSDTDDNFPLFELEKVGRPETGRYNTSCVFTPPQK